MKRVMLIVLVLMLLAPLPATASTSVAGKRCYCLRSGRAMCQEGQPSKAFSLYCKVTR